MHRFTGRLAYWLILSLLGWVIPLVAGVPQPERLTLQNGLPQGFVNSMIQDQRGFMWLSTRDGLCRYDGVRFRIYAHDPQQEKSLSFSSVYEIKEDNKGKLWVRTENNHVDYFDPVTERFHRISHSRPFQQALGRDQLVGIYPDQAGNAWVATQTNGFFRLNANGTVSHQYWAMKGDTVQRTLNALLLDRRGRLWLAAKDGLFRYDPFTGQFIGFRIAQGMPQNDVRGLYERFSGELMLGFPGHFALFNPLNGHVRKVVALPGNPANVPLFTRDYRGIDYINQNRYTDRTGLVPLLSDPTDLLPGSLPTGPRLGQFSALSMVVDRSNTLWIGLNGDGVIKYDLNKRPFQTWPYINNFNVDWLTQQLGVPLDAIPAVIRQESPYSIRHQFDGSKNLWMSSRHHVPYRYETASRLFIPVQPTGIESRWLPGGTFRLTALSVGTQGELWGLLGPSSQAVVRYNADKQTFTAFPLPLPANHPYVILAMVVDGGRVYLATQNHGLLRADLSTKRLIRWHSQGNSARSLPDDALLSLAQDPVQYNHLWIGTFGDGLCRLDKITGTIQRFTVRQGLPNNVIYAIRPDRDGHLWLSTNRGLCRFDTRTYETRNYMADNGLPSEEFNRFHDVALPNGRLIFGGIGGYTAFDPRRINEDPFKPVIALTTLRINNQAVNALTPNSPIHQDINETSAISLNHEQNFLSLDFAALQFNHSTKNQYRYKLTGLDHAWVYSGNQTSATYTNLSPGTYTFTVNASNTSGVWSPYSQSLRIIIDPPLWATWWAYTLYGLLLLGAVVIFVRVRIRRAALKNSMRLREQESAQLKYLNEVKSRFFANITHEFRTPLTLILTPLQELLQDTVDSPYHNRLQLVYRNANRLLRLINELLDLAKLDAGNLTVTPAPANLPEFLKSTLLIFTEEAQRKHIRLEVIDQFRQPYYWFDADKVEKVLTNLLSNALKFTDEAGSITLSVWVEAGHPEPTNLATIDQIRLSVHNTGAAIAKQKLPHLFDRFYQADPLADGAAGGSGIGLALVKELVEIMQGTIRVESSPAVGTTFFVDLPCLQASVSLIPDQNRSLGSSSSLIAPYNSTADTESVYQILLVEDDDDIAEYVTSILNTEWRVHRVNNGRLGLEAALASGPDLIISDVLMPEMNGYELCHQVKTNPVTSHIPVLLLTAKTALESRLEGLMAGADDYLAKPFQVDELRAHVRNRLEYQQRLRQYYRMQLLREGHLPSNSQAPEDDFMNRVYTVLESRLDDPTFGVEPLASTIGMSRMHLNRKVKAMTGLTPNELIRTVRLNRAADLLLTGTSISEVADQVGFDTAAYFSKVFKEQYHLTPSEYIDRNRHAMA